MSTTFIYAGVACLIAAVVGGGLSAFGIQIGPLSSLLRQLLLGLLGIVFLMIGMSLDQGGGSAATAIARFERTFAGQDREAPMTATFAGAERWMMLDNLDSRFSRDARVDIFIDGRLVAAWRYGGKNPADVRLPLAPGPHTFRFAPVGEVNGLPIEGDCGGGFRMTSDGTLRRRAVLKLLDGRATLSDCTIEPY